MGTARLILEPAEVEFGLAGIGTMQRRDVAVTNDGDRDVQVIAPADSRPPIPQVERFQRVSPPVGGVLSCLRFSPQMLENLADGSVSNRY